LEAREPTTAAGSAVAACAISEPCAPFFFATIIYLGESDVDDLFFIYRKNDEI
jgi:hypothetical protein